MRLLNRWSLLPALLMTAIYIGSSLPASDAPPPFENFDKLQHFLAYMALTVSWSFSLNKDLINNFRSSAILSLLYGIAIEIHQAGLPDRTPSLLDIAANGTGCIAALVILQISAREISTEPKKKQ
ncbi:MAG: VanZ family protein [bacterium]|nr:VanZ family protein [bacterium]